MKKRISDKARIQHMLSAICQIEEFTRGLTLDEYMQDLKLRLAVARLVEIIGEAANHVSEQTTNQFTQIEWQLLYRVRNIIVHEYFGVDDTIIWDATQRDVPILREKLENILEGFSEEME